MELWFLRGLRRGVVTTHYPAHPDASAQTLPSPPQFRANRITPSLADAMVAVCPSRALRRDGTTLIFDVGACSACGRCLAVAGAAARPSHLVELAATSREQLVKHIPLGEAAS